MNFKNSVRSVYKYNKKLIGFQKIILVYFSVFSENCLCCHIFRKTIMNVWKVLKWRTYTVLWPIQNSEISEAHLKNQKIVACTTLTLKDKTTKLKQYKI